MAANLHVDAPMTIARMHAHMPLLLPTAAALFTALAIGAAFELLPWDRPITNAMVEARTDVANRVFLRISWFGSTPVVLTVSAIAAALSWRRCPRLAIAIVVIALARPLAEFALKELVGRERPAGDRIVAGRGPSFPSGHPLATAASWCVLPLVAALYTRRRILWWTVAVSVWALAIAVAVSRVWLGVHWTSDVIGGLLLAVIGVAGAEWAVEATHPGEPCRQMDQMSDSRRITSTLT
jgi:undecaprenyl-diphosphatase